MSQFRERLTSLGCATYGDYLRSDHWKSFRLRYAASSLPRNCAVCSSRPVQLHHHTYERLGAEELSDVTPLCRTHHEAVHGWLKQFKKFVGRTAIAVSELRASLGPRPANARKSQARVSPSPQRLDAIAMLRAFFDGNPSHPARVHLDSWIDGAKTDTLLKNVARLQCGLPRKTKKEKQKIRKAINRKKREAAKWKR